MLAALALVLAQDQSQVSPTREMAGFTFPEPSPEVLVTESANGQVYIVELRRAGQEAAPPYLKLFSLPNPDGALTAAALFGLCDQEFAALAAASGLAPGPVTDGVQARPGGEAVSRSQSFSNADGSATARARAVMLQTSPMAAGAMLWLAPGQPESLLGEAEVLLAGLTVLPFAADALQAEMQLGIGYSVPLLWIRQRQAAGPTFALHCQGPVGSIFVMGGNPNIFGGELSESLVLGEQRGEADTVAAQFGGTIVRQNGLMHLDGERLDVGQRFVMELPGGALAEIRNAIYSDPNGLVCLLGGLYTWENRPAMTALLHRMQAEVVLSQAAPQRLERRAWAGISVRPPGRLEVQEQERLAFAAGGWVFTIQHDENPQDRSFEVRILREPASDVAQDPQQALRTSLQFLAGLWPGATIEDPEASAGSAFGRPAAVLRATLMVEGVAHAVDARRVTAAHANYQSLALFPADLESDHRPVLDFLLERAELWDESAPLAAACGASVQLISLDWRLHEYWVTDQQWLDLEDGIGSIIRLAPEPEIGADRDLEEALELNWGMDEAAQPLELQIAGRKIGAVELPYDTDDEGGDPERLQIDALTVRGDAVWRLHADCLREQREQVLKALAGIEFPAAGK